MRTAMIVIETILAVVIIASILLQPSKADALSGLIQDQGSRIVAMSFCEPRSW